VTVRRSLFVVCLVAALNGVLFMAYQRPDWTTQWADQDGYRLLGGVLAEDIRRIWTEPDEPARRAAARIEADDEYLRAGLANISRDRMAWLGGRSFPLEPQAHERQHL
jgi:hypothetical protein